MKKLVLGLLFLAFVQISYAQKTTTFILVRHAEKAAESGSDPELKAEGAKRAEALAALLNKASVDAVYEVALVHRLGRLALAEASVAVAVTSPHRAAAFQAGRWLIDTLKETVPIWKQEHWADGSREWVHPGLNTECRLPNSDQPDFRTASHGGTS